MLKCRSLCLLFLVISMLAAVCGSSFSQLKSATDTIILPGSPGGEVQDGTLIRPQGANVLKIIGFNPLVTRIRIEQSDSLVPAIGRNPNRTFCDGNPLTLGNSSFNLTGVNKVRFTVYVRGERRIAEAVRLEWETGKK